MVSFGFFFCVYVGVVLLFYEIKGGGGHHVEQGSEVLVVERPRKSNMRVLKNS
jgi:hypothetical protein